MLWGYKGGGTDGNNECFEVIREVALMVIMNALRL